MSYAELFTTSNFTFLRGASHPEELVERASELGLEAIAATDKNTFAGIVRGHARAKELGLQYIVGTCLELTNGQQILALPKTRTAYGKLCRLLTSGKRRTTKGNCKLTIEDICDWGGGSVLIIIPHSDPATTDETIIALKQYLATDTYVGLSPHYDGLDQDRFYQTSLLASEHELPLVALGNVLLHRAHRRKLADVLSCIREGVTIDKLGLKAQLNAERRLKSPFEMKRLFADMPEAIDNTLVIKNQCRFSLDELRYEYPDEVSEGKNANDRLRELAEEGLHNRYPDGVPLKVQALAEKELRLIKQLDYARYFLTVYDIVNFARSRGIICQGRGSAANSVVCYALDVTSIGPETISMVFERFVSEARNEPPDIDVDFEHERREEVIQHIYEKYGRHRAGICSTVVHFRSRAAIREVGKAMGLSEDAVSALSSQIWGWSNKGVPKEYVAKAGLDLRDQRLQLTLELAQELTGFPRHLSQHVGGFVMTKGRLDEFCVIENAAMEERTVIEWDKDDIDVLGMLKVDVLSLGMLTCLRKAFDLLKSHFGIDYNLATLPQEDAHVYDMLCRGDSIGLFQVESRAQMNFLPRMRPRTFYDLVVEVAIVRPGPIQGDMVHPYLKRRNGTEKVEYPSKELEAVLKRSLGVPLFQEQAMQIAIVAAGFDPSEADQLRRSLGAFRGPGSVEKFQTRFIKGCLDKGYDKDFAERCFRQLEGFSGYGFPESHAASFALLVYASAWIKCHYPQVYACAILNSQPMGFYAPAQLVRDAREHGVDVRPVCINASFWNCVLEHDGKGGWAVRLGFRQIKGMKEEDGVFIASARGNGYREVETVWRRAGIAANVLARLAEADAFASIGLNRREALWQAKAIKGDQPLPLFEKQENEGIYEQAIQLPQMGLGEEVIQDYVSTRLTLRDHPVKILRPKLGVRTIRTSDLINQRENTFVTLTGLVITRQRPGTASGVIFITLEDEAGTANIIVWPKTFLKFRSEVMTGRLIKVTGKLQREGIITHIISTKIEDCSHLLDYLGNTDASDGFIDPTWNSADEVKRPAAVGSEHGPTGKKSDQRQGNKRLARNPATKRAISGARHPREQAKKLFPSRDFH